MPSAQLFRHHDHWLMSSSVNLLQRWQSLNHSFLKLSSSNSAERSAKQSAKSTPQPRRMIHYFALLWNPIYHRPPSHQTMRAAAKAQKHIRHPRP